MKEITAEQQNKLLELAYEAQTHAYAPYSNYKVGACLLTEDGKYYQGCNIENAAFSPTNCAERTAFFKAVYDGERRFTAIAVATGADNPGFPCGVCRQVMAEFCDSDFVIITGDGKHNVMRVTLGEILPYAFGPKDLL